jgi:hypothetical protein
VIGEQVRVERDLGDGAGLGCACELGVDDLVVLFLCSWLTVWRFEQAGLDEEVGAAVEGWPFFIRRVLPRAAW